VTEDPNPLQWAVDGPPIGCWTTSNGTFDNVMFETYAFFADGAGFVQSGNAFSAETKHFTWSFEETGFLKICIEGDPPEFERRIDYCASWKESHGEFQLRTPTLVSCKRDQSGNVTHVDDAFSVQAAISGLGGLTLVKTGAEYNSAVSYKAGQNQQDELERKKKRKRIFVEWGIPIIGGLFLGWILIKAQGG